jgi:hypothetical protein
MSYSSYLDSMMRHGRDTFNARLRFTAPGGAILQCLPYVGAGYTEAGPLLVRFQEGSSAVLTSGILQLDINASFNLRGNEGYEWLYVGLQKKSDIDVQLCVGLLADRSQNVTTVVASPTRTQVLAPSAVTGPVTWFATLALMKRVGGVWDSSDANIFYGE